MLIIDDVGVSVERQTSFLPTSFATNIVPGDVDSDRKYSNGQGCKFFHPKSSWHHS